MDFKLLCVLCLRKKNIKNLVHNILKSETANLKKNQMEILELKNTISEITQWVSLTADQTWRENLWTGRQVWNEAWKGKIWNIQKTSWETQRIWRKKSNIGPRRKSELKQFHGWQLRPFPWIPKFMKPYELQGEKNKKKSTPRTIILKLQRTKDEEENLKNSWP